MARGGPRKADGPSKKGAKATVTLLTLPNQDEVVIPDMPDPNDFISLPGVQGNLAPYAEAALDEAGVDTAPVDLLEEPEFDVDWNPAVKRWWHDIWSSPMSSEFVKADIHGLYMACYYMHESLNPFYKLSDRLAAGRAWENQVKNYGLNPSARESLRWQVAQGTMAQQRTNQVREAASAVRNTKGVNDMAALYSRNG